MRSSLFYPLFVLAAAFAAHADDSPKLATTAVDLSKSIQPRSEGAYWFYKSVYFEEGTAISNGTTKEEVIGVREVEGMQCWKIKLTMDWRSLLDRLGGARLMEDDFTYFWEYFDHKGSYHFVEWDMDTDEVLTPRDLSGFMLTLPYPVKVGHTYEADGESWEVLDDKKLLQVKAGEFTCVVYQSLYEDPDDKTYNMRSRYYMCPGVGMIRYESDIWIDDGWELDMQDSLIKYDLKLPVEAKKSSTEK